MGADKLSDERMRHILRCAMSPKADVWADANLTQEDVAVMAQEVLDLRSAVRLYEGERRAGKAER